MKKIMAFIFSFQFSKLLILLETAVVVYLTREGVSLARLCVMSGFDGSLPWVATMVSCAWAAYGTSAAFYYNKGKAEEVAKISAGTGQGSGREI